MDEKVPESTALRTKEGTIGLESRKPHPPNQLVRMRSPVRIWVAAPKSLENRSFQGFFVAIFYFSVWVKMGVSWLTHILTHTRKGLKSAGQEGCASCPAFLSALHDLCHEAAHGGCSLVLLLPCSVGIGAEGEPSIVVPQHGGHRFYIHAVLKGCGGEGVPQVG